MPATTLLSAAIHRLVCCGGWTGIDIPNPNHYNTLGSTGGPVTILNTNTLKNSDFITSAFPAQYGNALAGVFDLRMRNGNDEKYEFWGKWVSTVLSLAPKGR